MAFANQAVPVFEPTAQHLIVEFYKRPKQNVAKSDEAGYPVYEDVVYTMIRVPGNKDEIVDRPLREEDKVRFRQQWQQFAAGQQRRADGLPLTEWGMIPASQAKTLEHFNVFTVEDLAVVADSNLQALGPGFRDLRQKAQDFLSARKGEAPLTALRAQFEDMKAQKEANERQLAELSAQVAQLQAAKAASSPVVATAPKK